MGGRLVQDEHRRVGQQCTGEDDPLSLPAPSVPFLSATRSGKKPRRVAYSPDLGITPVDPEVKAAVAEAAAGRLRPVIGQRFPLADAAAAHAAIESRATVGKTLLEVGTPPAIQAVNG